MNEKDKSLILERYQDRLRRYGEDVRALASGSRERQARRFRMLQEVGISEGDSVLDLGCGFGDFYEYLRGTGLRIDYTGYDISPDLIEVARKRFPDVRFEVRDVQSDGCPEGFDFAVASQVFNNRLQYEDNLELVTEVMGRLHEAVERGLAMDFLSTFVDYREDKHYYYDPGKILEIAKALSSWVTLRHDYLPYEFGVYVLKRPAYGSP